MAGGPCTPALVAAVGQAGALGSFGFAYSTPEQIDADLRRTRALADVPINANLFVFPPASAVADAGPALDAQAGCGLYTVLGVDPPSTVPSAPGHPDVAAQVDVLCSHAPRAVTFHFGLPEPVVLDRLKACGATVGASATTPDDAVALVARGVDFVIAQGAEAGGHRGTLDPEQPDHPIGSFALVRAVRERVEVPVVAAGGLMDGRDIAAAELLGADGAQLGTAFLCTDESGVAPLYRDVLDTWSSRSTVLTRGFSGRWARGVQNDYTNYMQDKPVLPFPLHNSLTAPLRAAAKRANSAEAQSVWAGQGFARMRVMPAAELVHRLIDERDAARAAPD
ncbi:MAG: nitronate monooxygenase [Pseudomonadota bacterium]